MFLCIKYTVYVHHVFTWHVVYDILQEAVSVEYTLEMKV